MKNILCVIVAMAVFSVAAQSVNRLVNGKVYSVIDPNAWTVFNDHIKIIGYCDGGIICESYTAETHDAGGQMDHSANPRYYPNLVTHVIHGQKFILKNLNVPYGSDISPPIKAIHTGQASITHSSGAWTTSSGNSDSRYQNVVSVNIYDVGVDYFPPRRVLTPEEQKAAKNKRAEQEKKTVRWLFSEATNGSASAQCSLGLRYLNGQGVETNKALAVEWLKKAATQGDIEANNKLAELAAAQTNSEASSTSATNSVP